MIADTAVTTSPWSSESILLKDFDFADLGRLDGRMDNETVAINNSYDRVWKQSALQVHQNLSTGTSVASSDCSDEHDLYLDIDADLNEHLFGDISTSLLNIIQDTDVSDTIALVQDFDWQSISCDTYNNNTAALSETEDSPNISCSEGDLTPVKNHSKSSSSSKCRSETFSDNRKWTSLSPEERLRVVEDLSHIVSRELGLREQMEVIRIINPTASVSPTDTEFVIELDSLNDDKLERIRECVCRHATNQCSPDSSQQDTPSKKFDKKLKTRERRSRQKAIRQRQRKDYRQMLKEKRSGLFVKEEVLSLTIEDPGSLHEDEGDGDVDILG